VKELLASGRRRTLLNLLTALLRYETHGAARGAELPSANYGGRAATLADDADVHTVLHVSDDGGGEEEHDEMARDAAEAVMVTYVLDEQRSVWDILSVHGGSEAHAGASFSVADAARTARVKQEKPAAAAVPAAAAAAAAAEGPSAPAWRAAATAAAEHAAVVISDEKEEDELPRPCCPRTAPVGRRPQVAMEPAWREQASGFCCCLCLQTFQPLGGGVPDMRDGDKLGGRFVAGESLSGPEHAAGTGAHSKAAFLKYFCRSCHLSGLPGLHGRRRSHDAAHPACLETVKRRELADAQPLVLRAPSAPSLAGAAAPRR
jgi:hypothetical protein